MNAPHRERVIYTLRHAAIDLGRKHIIAGRLNPSLNDEGRAQIKDMAAAKVPLAYDLVISSPQRRALETAALVTGLPQDQITTSELCMERNYGLLEGVAPEEIGRIEPATHYVSVGGVEHSLNPPGGETLEQLRERVVAFHEFVDGTGAKRPLVVSHGTFLQQYHGYLQGLDVYHSLQTGVSYLEVNAFEFRGQALFAHSRLYRPEFIEQPW